MTLKEWFRGEDFKRELIFMGVGLGAPVIIDLGEYMGETRREPVRLQKTRFEMATRCDDEHYKGLLRSLMRAAVRRKKLWQE